ncbi:hypothetical protein RCC89_05455 [Cytophagaceae bacterium ABcell3]|nr:hypothetical protein RCC89_05455 [Cytophagaceae bacterium ABcell3]
MSSSKKVIINYFFPRFVRIGSVLILAIGFLGFSANTVAAMLALLAWIMVQTTHHGIEIDQEKKLYKKYLSVLGFEFGSYESYKELAGLTIDEDLDKQQNVIYQGYVDFSKKGYLMLIKDKSREKVLSVVNKLADAYDLEIIDETKG